MRSNTIKYWHGNLSVIHQKGILISGLPGAGKSSLSLELLKRGHQFVSDDAVFIKKEGKKIYGYAPENYQGFLFIRPFDLINIEQKFGANACLFNYPINLMVTLIQNLKQTTSTKHYSIQQTVTTLLSLPLPQIIITYFNMTTLKKYLPQIMKKIININTP